MESSHLVIFSTSGKFITKFNVVRWISLSKTLFWTGARGRIPITLSQRHLVKLGGINDKLVQVTSWREDRDLV